MPTTNHGQVKIDIEWVQESNAFQSSPVLSVFGEHERDLVEPRDSPDKRVPQWQTMLNDSSTAFLYDGGRHIEYAAGSNKPFDLSSGLFSRHSVRQPSRYDTEEFRKALNAQHCELPDD